MSVSRPPSAAELGEELSALRKAAGLTLRQLEQMIGMSNTKISFWETGRRLPSLDDLATVLEALGVRGDDRERILTMRREAEGPGVLMAGSTTIGAQLSNLIKQEESARKITEVAPLLIPGLLQTSAYAGAIHTGYPDADIRVRLRRGRQEILTREENPVQFHALIEDEVLVRHIAPPAAMAEQLRHLLRMAELPNVTIQLVHSTHSGYTPMLAGPFILMEFDTAPAVVHLEHHRASATLWQEEDVRSFRAAADQIAEAAMTPDRTSEVIVELIQGMEKP